ncbi:hypothetical protein OCV99_11895 [Dorea acetigenes]|uniref:Uncharacterized protein n=1 Tax=Dorea acetigenes TaxID=2981787 RepID=A0ABT2RPN0_9FIRM|nr:hypothetical protein [Dorea acetigenes]MCU6687231.1 hypothetical protein [Dorea acetigenes]SCJ32229.1 Uncharacterised protein [uncultured Clostridium sp.]
MADILSGSQKEEKDNAAMNLSNVINSLEITVPEKQKVEIEKDEKSDPNSIDVIEMNVLFEMKSYIYQKVLGPELQENESLKREQKKALMNNIFKILKWQFIFTYVFVTVLLAAVLFSAFLKIEASTISTIIKFIQFYITSIVVELISILFFIVKSVFDKSIVELFRNFDREKK